MINFISLFIAVLILSISQVFVWSRFYKEKISFKNLWLYISLLVLTLAGIFVPMYVNAYIKIVLITLLMMMCSYSIFRRKINETLISVVFSQLILSLSDIMCAFVFVFFAHSSVGDIRSSFFTTFLGNIIVSIIFIIVSFIPFVITVYLELVRLTNKLKTKTIVYISFLIMFSINFYMAVIYYRISSIWVIVINCLFLLIYSFIVYKSLNERKNSLIIKEKNDSLMESLNEYENMVDRQRVDNHENKNQLLIIKNMIKKNDKNVIKYIDTIVKDEKEDDEALYTKVKTIPSGGLQGIIYQKMLTMKDKGILYSLDVSRDVRKIDLDDLSMEDNYRLCKIIGVFLDNAIEESSNINDGCIMISLYVDDELFIIEISNKFIGSIDVDKLDEVGFTTKGNGHGYGLSLVKEILTETDKFVNERIVTKDIFKQIIKVKVK